MSNSSISQNLEQRTDIDNEDIPFILERAEELRQLEMDRVRVEKNRSSLQDVKEVGQELEIPEHFIEQALEGLRQERLDAQVEQQAKNSQHEQNWKKILRWIQVFAMIVLGILCFRLLQWIWLVSSGPTDELRLEKLQIESNSTSVIPMNRAPDQYNLTDTEIETKASQERTVTAVELRNLKDLSNDENVMSEKITERILDPFLEEEEKTQETPSKELVDVIQDVQPLEVIEEYEKEVEKDTPIDLTAGVLEEVSSTIDVSKFSQKMQGTWILDAYLLYEDGVEFPMEIPIVYEPLELPKTWRFTNGRYKRVMDKHLSFSAQFEIVPLKSNLKPRTDISGSWGLLEASNVVSTIPGIRRQNDYFTVLLTNDTLTIWYLGQNSYRLKIPSQAERYVRQ